MNSGRLSLLVVNPQDIETPFQATTRGQADAALILKAPSAMFS